MGFSILESIGTKQKGKAKRKFALSLHDQPKAVEIHMRTFAGFSNIREHASVCCPCHSPVTAATEPGSSSNSLQIRTGREFISSTVCLPVLVSVSTKMS